MSELRKANTDLPYFLTFTVVDWIDLFTRKEFCEIIIDSLKHCVNHKGLILYEYVIMPSHMHLIAQSSGLSLSPIIRDFKRHTANTIISELQITPRYESRADWLLAAFQAHASRYKQNQKHMVWQKKSHPLDIHSDHFQIQKTAYIHNNPVEAGLVTDGSFWQYSSANPYSPIETSRM